MKHISQFQEYKNTLFTQLQNIPVILDTLGAYSRKKNLHNIVKDIQESNFRVLICGEFKRGKSCLINALLQENIVPMKVAPCTGTVTEIRYASKPGVTLIPTHDAPLSVPFSELQQYSTIQGKKGHLLRKLIVEYPSRFLQNGITLIDSPGLNEDWSRTRASLREIATADALILVLSCEMALSQSELQFIQTHLLTYTDRLFFVWNRADAIWDKPEEKASLEKRSTEYLSPYSDRVFFLSAREALLGHLQQDADKLLRSNIHSCTNSLEQHLVEHHSQHKLYPLWQSTMHSITYIIDTLLTRLDGLLQLPLPTLQDKQEQITSITGHVQQKRLEIRACIQETLQDVVDDILQITDDYIQNLPEDLTNASASIAFAPKINRQEREDIIIAWFVSTLQQSLHHLAHKTIRESMLKHFQILRSKIDQLRAEFYQEVNSVLIKENSDIVLFPGKWVDELSIIASTTLSMMFLHLNKEKFSRAILQVKAIRGWLTGSSLSEDDRRKLSAQLVLSFSQDRDSLIFNHRSYLEETMKNMQALIDQELQSYIDDAVDQVNFALQIRTGGVSHTEKQRLLVEESRIRLHTIKQSLLQNKHVVWKEPQIVVPNIVDTDTSTHSTVETISIIAEEDEQTDITEEIVVSDPALSVTEESSPAPER